jgi:hypothetical protein
MVDEEIYSVMHSDCPLWRKAYVRAMKLAGDVINENPATANHANRVIWANAVLADPTPKVQEMKTHILLNATIGANPNGATSNDVEFVISGLINAFAKG